MKIRKIFAAFVLFVLGSFIFSACSMPAMRYIGYRLSPDTTPTTGDIARRVAALPSPATIYLDKYAIPHIVAGDERTLAFALGYMQGRDRRFQLEMMKLLAAGRMRELIGDRDKSGAVSRLEILSRMFSLDDDAQKVLDAADPADVALLDAFAAGVNAATKAEPRPFEFRLLDYRPEPWTAKDSLRIAALIAFGLSKNWEQELGRLELIVHQLRTGGTVERALQIWKPRYDLPPHLIGEKPATDPFAKWPPIAPELEDYLTHYVKGMSAPAVDKAASENLIDEPSWAWFFRGPSASNNWAMSGAWTKTGAGAYASDPHMPHALPPLGYLAHIRCEHCAGGDFDVIGGCFVGLPAVTFGTNGRVAWGPTANWADVADLYVEKPTKDRPGFYESEQGPLAFRVRNEIFRIRKEDGTFAEENLSVRISRHGVVLNDFIDRLPGDFPLVAIKRAEIRGRPITALRHLYRAGSVTEARNALSDFSLMVGHWSLADASGRVAYCGPLNLPRRATHLGTVPVPGWTGTYEWDGYIPINDLPWVENPSTGFVASANNQVVQPESQGYPLNFEGNVPHRFKRISETLAKGSTGAPLADQISTLQRDDLDMGWLQLRPLYSRALASMEKDANPRVSAAARKLLEWDGHAGPDDVAPTIFQSLNARLLRRNFEDEMSDKTLHFALTYFNMEPVVFDVLGDPANPAWDDRRTAAVEDAETVIRSEFRATVAGLAETYGSSADNWKWNSAAPFVLNHPFGSEKKLASYLNRGPLPTHGSGETVDKHQFTREDPVHFPIKYGPVLRIQADLSNLAASRMSIPGGESGRPASGHYDDLLPLYMAGEGASMTMDMERIQSEAVGKIELIRE